MDAIAIIARTDAYYKALMNYDAFYHVKASDVSYHGVGLTLQNLDIDQAVDKTRHLVMTYEEQPFPAAWTENSGGKTANYASIYRKNTPTPAGVEAPFAQKIREDSQWSFTINTQELAKVVKTKFESRGFLFHILSSDLNRVRRVYIRRMKPLKRKKDG